MVGRRTAYGVRIGRWLAVGRHTVLYNGWWDKNSLLSG